MKIYLLLINDLYVNVKCWFVLTKEGEKRYRWLSLDHTKASDNYVTASSVPKWKAIRWGKDMGTVIKAKILILLFLPFMALGQKCFTGDFEMSFYDQPITNGNQRSLESHCLTIYLETDWYTVEQFGGDRIATMNWMQANWDSVALLYANEGVSISVTDVYVPEGPGYGDTTSFLTINKLLYLFSIKRGDDVNGRFKHFMTLRPWGGGVAWLGGYCTPRQGVYNTEGLLAYYGAYAVSGSLNKVLHPISSNPWNYIVLAHEMGHNLGLNHTQDCKWGPTNDKKIDDCYPGQGVCDAIYPIQYSSIMSYCHLAGGPGIDLIGVGFGDLPGNRMRDNIGSAACLNYTPGLLTLGGILSGEYQADEVFITHGGNSNLYVTIRANSVEIDRALMVPTFQVYGLGCQ